MDWRRFSPLVHIIVLVVYIADNSEACNCTQPPPCLSVNGQPIKFPEIENQNSVGDKTSDIPCLAISCPTVGPFVSLGPLSLYYHGYPGVCVDTYDKYPAALPVSVETTMRCTAVEIVYDESSTNKTEGDAVQLFTQCTDTVPPVCSPLNDTIVVIQLGDDGTTVQFKEPTATDDINGTVTLQSRTHAPGALFPVGRTEVCYNFSDASLNTVECCFNVTVIEVDTEPPYCLSWYDGNKVVDPGENSTIVDFVEPEAKDNSGIVTLQSSTHTPGQFFPVGVAQVCYTFADPSNYTVDCCFEVRITERKISDKTTTTANPTARPTCHPNETNCGKLTGQRGRCRNCGWIVVLFIPILIVIILAVRRRRKIELWIISHNLPDETKDKDPEANKQLQNGSSTTTTTTTSPKTKNTSTEKSSPAYIANPSYEGNEKDPADDGGSAKTQKASNNKKTDEKQVSKGGNGEKESSNDAKKRKASAAKNDAKTRKQSDAKK